MTEQMTKDTIKNLLYLYDEMDGIDKPLQKGDYIVYVSNLVNKNGNVGKKYLFKVLGIATASLTRYARTIDRTIRLDLLNLETGDKWHPTVEESAPGFIPLNIAYEILVENNNYSIDEFDTFLSDTLTTKSYNILHSDRVNLKSIGELLEYSEVTHDKPNEVEFTVNFNNKEESKMNGIVNANSKAVKSAAKTKTGKALNAAIMKKVRPSLPLAVRGYAEHPIANVVLANLVSFAVKNFFTNGKHSEKASWAASAMMDAAMFELVDTINVEELFSDLLEVEIPDED